MASLYLAEVSRLDSAFDRFLPEVEPARRNELLRSGPNRTALCRLGAGLLVRTLFESWWGNSGIQKTPEGQPYLPGAPCFSISHSGSLILLGVSDRPIGVDIQEQRTVSVSRIASRFFHPNETERIRISTDPDSEFLSLWTAKESYVKAKGLGFSLPFSSFSLQPGANGSFLIEIPFGSPFQIRTVTVPNGYSAAVCSQDPVIPEHPVLCIFDPDAPFGFRIPSR